MKMNPTVSRRGRRHIARAATGVEVARSASGFEGLTGPAVNLVVEIIRLIVERHDVHLPCDVIIFLVQQDRGSTLLCGIATF